MTPKISPALILKAELYLAAKSNEDTTREIVHAYQTKIIEENNWEIVPCHPDVVTALVRLGGTDLTPANICYLVSEEDFIQYSEYCDIEAAKAGFSIPGAGYCPLIMAETALMIMEALLIKEMAKMPEFKNISRAKLVCQNDPTALNRFIKLSTDLISPFIQRDSEAICEDFYKINFYDGKQSEIEAVIDGMVVTQPTTEDVTAITSSQTDESTIDSAFKH